MNMLVTGCAGFIGFHLALERLNRGERVVGVDNLNNYYDVNLKQARLEILKRHSQFEFVKLDLADKDALAILFKQHQFDRVVNLAAQAGVRYSLINPYAYINSNINGFINILEQCRHHGVKNLVYASSSSVYGANTKQPFSESEAVDHPLALYAATKKSNELMAHAYSHLYRMPSTGLRFFTVYGPWGRPDMALFLFTKSIIEGKPIDVFNHGKMIRDFTYIDDIISGVCKAIDTPATPNDRWDSNEPDSATSNAPYRIYNIGNNNPTQLMDYIRAIENALGKEAILNMQPIQAGDVPSTHADISLIEKDLDYRPSVSVEEGVQRFINWFMSYYY
jgi:UDP-glucuronate 4-epimerase